MNTVVKQCLASLLTIGLLGCGGGSGTDNDVEGNLVASPSKLTLDIVRYSDTCFYRKQPAAGVTVLIHKAGGEILTSYATDGNGKLSVDWPKDGRHVTMIYREMNGQYKLESQIDIQYTDLGVISFLDEALASECSCTTLDIDWQDIKASMPEYSLNLNGEQQLPNFLLNNGIESYEVCPDAKNQYGKLEALLLPDNHGPSYKAEFELNNLIPTAVLKLNINEFKNAGRALTVNTNVPNVTLNSFTPSKAGRSSNIFISRYDKTPLRVFEQAGVKSIVRAYQSSYESRISYYRTKQYAISSTENTVDIMLPQNKEDLLSLLQKNLTAVTTSNSIAYDYSQFQSYNGIQFTLNGSVFQWLITGPLKGTIADLELPKDVQSVLDSNPTLQSFDIDLYGYDTSWDYKTFNRKMAERSRDLSKEMSGDFNDYVREGLTISLQ
jgi:hypothetical protein